MQPTREESSPQLKREGQSATMLSCSECKRFKLKCNRIVPCSNCIRRGRANTCPDGKHDTSQNTRGTEKQYHQEITPIRNRIQEASASLPSVFSNEPHPSQSETAFPSLSPSASTSTAAPAPSASGGPRIRPAVVKQPVFSDTITLSAIDLSSAGRDGKQATLGEIMKQVTTKHKVKLEASTNQKTRQATFYLKADSENDLEKAKRSLVASLSPVVTLIINIPASTIMTIIGPRGATLKQIRDQTGVEIDIPKKEVNRKGHIGNDNPGDVTPSLDNDEEEPTVPVTLTGPTPFIQDAQALLNQVISPKIFKATQRVRDIPAHILPFIIARKVLFLSTAQEAGVTLILNAPNREITASGERHGVIRLVELIRSNIESLRTRLTSLKLAVPKRQHRLLVGDAVQQIMTQSKCAVAVPNFDNSSDEITIWGQPNDLSNGLTAVIQHANSKYKFPIPGHVSIARNIVTFFRYISYDQVLKEKNPRITAFLPSTSRDKTSYTIDLVGDKPVVDSAVRLVSEAIGKLYGATKDVNIDWLLHRVITVKNAKKIKQFHETHNVQVFFPPEYEEFSSVLLVYDPFSPKASPSPDDKKRHIDDVEKELLKLAKDAADLKSETVNVDDSLPSVPSNERHPLPTNDPFMIKIPNERPIRPEGSNINVDNMRVVNTTDLHNSEDKKDKKPPTSTSNPSAYQVSHLHPPQPLPLQVSAFKSSSQPRDSDIGPDVDAYFQSSHLRKQASHSSPNTAITSVSGSVGFPSRKGLDQAKVSALTTLAGNDPGHWRSRKDRGEMKEYRMGMGPAVQVFDVRRTGVPGPTIHDTPALSLSNRERRLSAIFGQHVVELASLNSHLNGARPRCYSGTRENVLKQIRPYLGDNEGCSGLTFLRSAAGVGKTAIMQTLAERESEDKKTLGTIFYEHKFSRQAGSFDRLVFPILAYQIALQDEQYADDIIETLNRNKLVLDEPLGMQFAVLIAGPWTRRGSVEPYIQPLLIILDGLDGCGMDKEPSYRGIVELISHYTRTGASKRISLIVSNPPESLFLPSPPPFMEIEIPIDSDDACEDMEGFLRIQFDAIGKRFPTSTPEDWPPEDDLLRIATAASGYFAFSTSIIDFVGDPNIADPVGQLNAAIAYITGRDLNISPFATLDNLYSEKLHRASPLGLSTAMLFISLFLIPSVRFAKVPPSMVVACNILCLSESVVHYSLGQLSTLLYIPPDDSANTRPLKLLHSSFEDFLLNPARSGTQSIDLVTHKLEIQQCCTAIAQQVNGTPKKAGGLENVQLTWCPRGSDAGEERKKVFVFAARILGSLWEPN